MYIIKNALRCVGRSKGRNILIGIIALVISVSACLGLSIRQAAESANESSLEGLSVTGTISYDRSAMMNSLMQSARGQGNRQFDREQFISMMSGVSSLSLEEYEKYASAGSVRDFYYTVTASFNGNDALQPVGGDASGGETAVTGEDLLSAMGGEMSGSDGMSGPGGMGGPGMGGPGMGGPGMSGPGGMAAPGMEMLSTADFTVVGYSRDDAMTDFKDGTASILEGGAMFAEGTADNDCVISEELAIYNDLSVGDTITLVNPAREGETYRLKIVGLYTSAENNDLTLSAFGISRDPANRIFMSAAALQAILDASDKASVTVTDENTGEESDSAVTGTISPIYVFADTDGYYAFEEEVKSLGLDDAYVVSSPDLTAYENSLTPIRTLSSVAGWFLLVILVIGGVILVVLNIFNVRERKYEVGVLTAMGMKKWKVAAQFICEILVVTMIAIMIGAAVGAVSSVPVTNALLRSRDASRASQQTQMTQSFGRAGSQDGTDETGLPGDSGGAGSSQGIRSGAANFVMEVNSAMNLTVVLQMLGVGLLLTLLSSMASVLFIMRYDPLKILANRD